MRASMPSGTRSPRDGASIPLTCPTPTWGSVNHASSLAIAMSASAT